MKTQEYGGPSQDSVPTGSAWVPAAHCAPDRLERVLAAIEPPGSSVILLGEPGSGKTRLAEEAAYAFEEHVSGGLLVFVLPAPSPDGAGGGAFDAGFLASFGIERPASDGIIRAHEHHELTRRVLRAIEEEAGELTPLVVAPSIDLYPTGAATLLAQLVRSHKVRVIATARNLSGAAERISRDPKVGRLSVGPLTLSESTTLLLHLLDGERVEFSTLRRWYAITNGNAYSLTVLALALDRRGLVRRDKGMIWEDSGAIGVPEEFIAYLEETCSPEELEALETIALAEPLNESVLLAKISPSHLNSLQRLGLVLQRSSRSGDTALTLSHPLLASALKERMLEARRTQIYEELYLALKHDLGSQEPTRVPGRLLRLVTLGLDTGRALPLEWLSTALGHLVSEPDLPLTLRVALAVADHADVAPDQLALAAIMMSQSARVLGDRSALYAAAELVQRVLRQEEAVAAFPAQLRVRLKLELAQHLTLDQEQYTAAFAIITDLEREGHVPGSSVAEMVRTARALLFARTGQLQRALLECPPPDELGRMQVEWERGHARVVSSLVLAQQGRFSQAIRIAEEARVFASLGEHVEQNVAEQLTLSIFVGHWLSGATGSAVDVMDRLNDRTIARLSDTGFIEAALAVLALSEGRWHEAAQRAARALDRHGNRDCFGITPLLHAISALAGAALGERNAARQAIHAAEIPRPGVGQELRGVVRTLTLEARHWNREPDVVEQAQKVVTWAAAEGLPLVELRALQVLSTVQQHVDGARMARVRTLADAVDDPLGSAFLSYFEELNAGESAWDAPSARVLADLGVWLPLPRTPMLSAREREIALHASLGYSSRWIAERFHLSSRTVETHLRHVFTKLGAANRDELRAHFRGDLATRRF